jgi:chemotaxis regulatin CheY-phosphate phosphatase CheZ
MTTKETLQVRIQQEIAELTNSISGLVEGFKKLQRPLVESHEKVPQATNQLDKISAQTEEATHRMLDTVEKITQREDDVIKGIEEIRGKAAQGDIAQVEQLAAEISEKANQNLNDAFSIMDSLQFQDITAQQMDHAASLLEDIEEKLNNILNTIGAKGDEGVEVTALERKVRAYDPHADFVDRKANQADIDTLFSQQK